MACLKIFSLLGCCITTILQILQNPQHCRLTSATISLLCSLEDHQPRPCGWIWWSSLNPNSLEAVFSFMPLTFALTMKSKFHSQGLHHPAPAYPFGFISYPFLPQSPGSSHSSHLSALPPCQALSCLGIFAMYFSLLGSSPQSSDMAVFFLLALISAETIVAERGLPKHPSKRTCHPILISSITAPCYFFHCLYYL